MTDHDCMTKVTAALWQLFLTLLVYASTLCSPHVQQMMLGHFCIISTYLTTVAEPTKRESHYSLIRRHHWHEKQQEDNKHRERIVLSQTMTDIQAKAPCTNPHFAT